MNKQTIPYWQSLLFKLLVLVLAMTGFAQMPIFKRYYIADIPGLGWLAQFYTTHVIHYIAAIVFLVIISYFLGLYFLYFNKTCYLRASAWPRLTLYGIVILTGAFRVAKNLPDVHFDPTTTMLLDWIHLFAVLVLGLTALVLWLLKKNSYLVCRVH